MTRTSIIVWSGLCMALGASITANFARPVQAQTQTRAAYRECYLMKVWVANGGKLADKFAAVPAGWTPVGGAGTGEGGNVTPGVVLCR